MTKENFINKWASVYNVNDTTNPYFIADLEAVIAHEIAKAQEVKLEEAKPQPALNPIAEAYHNYKPIRWILWNEGWNIKKHSDTESIDRNGKIYDNKSIVFNFDTNPEEWELYTEPAEQTSSQVKVDNSFDKDRFEAMFRAVLASGVQQNFECFKIDTTYFLQQLDAYYATKEGGNNG